ESRKALKIQQNRGTYLHGCGTQFTFANITYALCEDARAEAQKEKCLAAQDEARYQKHLAAEEEARCRAEEDEIKDNPDADREEEVELEASPKKRKPSSKNAKGKYWNQSDEDGLVLSEEELPPPKRQRGSLQIVVGMPTRVVSKLPPRRGHARTISTASSVTVVSSPSHPPPTSDASSTPPAKCSSKHSAAPFTPYSQDNSAYKTQGRQSPSTQSLLSTTYHHFRMKIALEEPFPDGTLRVAMAKASFIEACQEDGVPRRLARFRADKLYVDRMSDSIGDRVAQLRGEVKTKAQALVSGQYALASLSDENLKKEVQRLTTRGMFHFEDTKQHKGMFKNIIIPMVFAEQWLKRKSAEGAGKYSKHFNPCSLPLIALIVTAVECALCDYETGAYSATSNLFTQEEYRPAYQRHLASLEKYRKKAPAQLAKLQKEIWTDGWRIAGRNPPKLGDRDSDLDDDDFEEVLQQEAGSA
ncbi:hypothetical protein EWM64_g7940, partial [Hericium alpestre]